MSWCCRCNHNKNSSDPDYNQISPLPKNMINKNKQSKNFNDDTQKLSQLPSSSSLSLENNQDHTYSRQNYNNFPSNFLPPKNSIKIVKKTLNKHENCIKLNHNNNNIVFNDENNTKNDYYQSYMCACELLICHPTQNMITCKCDVESYRNHLKSCKTLNTTTTTIQSNDMREQLCEKLLKNNKILTPTTPPPSPQYYPHNSYTDDTEQNCVDSNNFLSVELKKLALTTNISHKCGDYQCESKNN